MPEKDKQDAPIEIPFTGKLLTNVDPVDVGLQNFTSLKNFRYTDSGITGVHGQSKINTTALTPYAKIKDLIHFKKTSPDESYIVCQAFNAGMTASKIYYNSNAIGSAGDFEATELYSLTGTVPGRFSNAPDGAIVFCDGNNTLIWGGKEARIGAAWNVAAYGGAEKDHTEAIQEASTVNYANINGSWAEFNDPGIIQLHFNNNLNLNGTKGTSGGDSTYSASATGTPVYSSTSKKFGYSAYFQGTGSVNNWGINTTYELAGGDTADWQCDFWVNPGIDNDEAGNDIVAYAVSKTPDASDKIEFRAARQSVVGGSIMFYFIPQFKIYNGGTTAYIVELNATVNEYSYASPWHHVCVTKDATEYKMYVDGVLVETVTKAVADGMPTVWDDLKIGYDGTNYFDGYLDEFHIAESEEQTAAFSVPQCPYPDEALSGTTGGPGHLYIASLRPIQGIKLYIDSAHKNDITSESVVEYWNGRAWSRCSSIVDGTSSDGKTFHQTGTISFASTVDLCRAGIQFGIQAYWYRIAYTFVGATIVYFATVNQPMQPITDIWDQDYRLITGCFFKKTAGYEDYLLNIFSNTYDSDLPETYIDASSATSSYELIVGFPEKTMGVYIGMAAGYENSTASVSTVSYWNGSTWTAFGATQDETSVGGATLAQSGILWWDPADKPRTITYYAIDQNEYRRAMSGEEPMYYYKITFGSTLDSSARIFYIAGIPAPQTIPTFSLAEMFNDRLWLFDEYNGERNIGRCTAAGTNCVFSGHDTLTLYFGDTQQITAAIPIFSKSGSSIWENLIVCKLNETYIVDGTGTDDFKRYLISDNYGCIGRHTMDSCDVEYENQPWFNRNGAIWLSASGPVMFDASTVAPIYYDIGNYFDRNSSDAINATYSYLSYGYYDNERREYHLMIPSGTSATICNKEFVYDVRRKKWFEVARGISVGELPSGWTDMTADTNWTTILGTYSGGEWTSADFGGYQFVSLTPDSWASSDTSESIKITFSGVASLVLIIIGSEATIEVSIASGDITDISTIGTISSFQLGGTETTFTVSAIELYDTPVAPTISNVLQCACVARSTTGILYQYGGTEDGFLWRLENTGFFGTAGVVHSFRLGDQAVMGNSYTSAYLRRTALTSVCKTAGTNVALYHYGDGNNTATTLTTNQSIATTRTGYRINQDFTSHAELDFAYHGIGLSYTITGTEGGGYTPLRLLLVFKADGKIKL